MSKLVILRGNSGSGKTTIARLLQEKSIASDQGIPDIVKTICSDLEKL